MNVVDVLINIIQFHYVNKNIKKYKIVKFIHKQMIENA